VIAITGSVTPEMQNACREAGINELLPKPFTAQTLISRSIHCVESGADLSTTTTIPTREYIAEQLRRLSGGDGAFAKRMLDIIRRELPTATRQMREAVAIDDWETVGRIAHRMRPCITSLRMDDMLQELSGIEDTALYGLDMKALPHLVLSLSDRLDALMKYLEPEEAK
jgi:hypothetical protein